jgi:hypothetical protein
MAAAPGSRLLLPHFPGSGRSDSTLPHSRHALTLELRLFTLVVQPHVELFSFTIAFYS